MRVICIDNSNFKNTYNKYNKLLVEGEIYTVIEIRDTVRIDGSCGKGYRLLEFASLLQQLRMSFSVDRFIPLSEIDEMELVNKNISELTQ